MEMLVADFNQPDNMSDSLAGRLVLTEPDDASLELKKGENM
jgi:hypothetical protein